MTQEMKNSVPPMGLQIQIIGTQAASKSLFCFYQKLEICPDDGIGDAD